MELDLTVKMCFLPCRAQYKQETAHMCACNNNIMLRYLREHPDADLTLSIYGVSKEHEAALRAVLKENTNE